MAHRISVNAQIGTLGKGEVATLVEHSLREVCGGSSAYLRAGVRRSFERRGRSAAAVCGQTAGGRRRGEGRACGSKLRRQLRRHCGRDLSGRSALASCGGTALVTGLGDCFAKGQQAEVAGGPIVVRPAGGAGRAVRGLAMECVFGRCYSQRGTCCGGITPVQHAAGGLGFDPPCVQACAFR